MYSSPSACSPKLEMLAGCCPEVGAVEERQRPPAIDEPAGDRAARLVVVLDDGQGEPAPIARAAAAAVQPFHDLPAEVAPVEHAGGDDIDLFPARVDVEPHHFGEQGLHALAVAQRIVGSAAVAEPDVELAVGAEHEIAAVVVVERLLDEQ